MALAPDLEMTVGDRRPTWIATLKDGANALVTLSVPTLLMVNAADNTVKINYGAMTVVGPGVASYAWGATDTTTAGDFYLWVRDVNAGLPWHWPFGGRKYLLRITPAG